MILDKWLTNGGFQGWSPKDRRGTGPSTDSTGQNHRHPVNIGRFHIEDQVQKKHHKKDVFSDQSHHNPDSKKGTKQARARSTLTFRPAPNVFVLYEVVAGSTGLLDGSSVLELFILLEAGGSMVFMCPI